MITEENAKALLAMVLETPPEPIADEATTEEDLQDHVTNCEVCRDLCEVCRRVA